MLIDSHTHVWADERWLPRWTWQWYHESLAHVLGMPMEVVRKRVADSCDPTGGVFTGNMDGFGVERAVICVVDMGLTVSGDDSALPIEEVNRLYYEMVQRHPGRLILAVGVDPRRKNAVQLLDKGVREWGARSLKLYPPAGWYPNDRACYPLYEKCVELGIPANFHTGPIGGRFRAKFSQPVHLDDVAVDFPELTIHCTHLGHGMFMEMLAIARARSNIVCDLAGWLPWAKASETGLFVKMLRYLMDMLGPGRIMFASDTVGFIGDPRLGEWVKAVKNIPVEAERAGVRFTDEELEGFYWKTASRVLRLAENHEGGERS